MAFRSTRIPALGALAALSVAVVQPASAHPHVWVSVETTVIYDNQTITGLRQRWLFDEFYSSMAIQGLDANGDGIYDRSELAELAKVNIEGLKEFDYFTFAKLGNQPLAFDAPTDFLMEHTETAEPPSQDSGMSAAAAGVDEPRQSGSFWTKLSSYLTGPAKPQKPKVVALEFTLPLQQPVLAEAENFNFSTYDPSFFIWFDLAKDNPVKLADGAPAGCKVDVDAPLKDGQEQLQQLGEAAFEPNDGVKISFGLGRTVTVSCPK